MKNFTFLIILNLIYLAGFSQSNIRLNNYWDNTYYINPASIYSEYQFVASAAARKQWIGFPGAPETEYATFTGQTYKRNNEPIVQLGLKVYHDNIGYTSLIDIAPSVSKAIRISDALLFNFGMAYKIQNISYDMSRAKFEIVDNDPVKYEYQQKKSMGHNVDVGIELVGRNFLFGLVGQNLVTLFSNDELVTPFRDDVYMQTNTNFIYFMYKSGSDGLFNWLFGACAINNEKFNQGEFKVSGIYNTSKFTNVELGGFFRTKKEFGVLFGVDLSKTVRLACSYDYHVGDISYSSFGTPEIMFVWKFREIPPQKRIIKCSDCKKVFK